ncbi:hypothetical protein EV589_2762 [Mycobacterium sp. BK558]|nr:hypothetical protein EV589_2762 [Mycobacterium sp. BK558]
MRDRSPVEVQPITEADIPAVADFLHRSISSQLSTADWTRAMTPTWEVSQPNFGYLLREEGRVVGAHLALYSERMIDGRLHRICNLGTWCVAEQHRAAGLRLLRSLLRQKGYTFTDLTPNRTIVALNERLGFTRVDTTWMLAPNIPWPVWSRVVRVVDTRNEIDALLGGQDRKIYRDHVQAAAARHVVLTKGDRHCYVMFRADYGRIKRRPTFATILYVSDRELFGVCAPYLYRYLLLRHGLPATLAEMRVVERRPPRSVPVAGPSKMYLSEDLEPDQIDDLYSELTCFAYQGRFPQHGSAHPGQSHVREEAVGST